MTTNRPFTMLAALIFLVMAVAHAYRIVTHFQIVLGSHTIALAISWVAIVVTLVMAWGLYREARR
jgi:hypothetical protein